MNIYKLLFVFSLLFVISVIANTNESSRSSKWPTVRRKHLLIEPYCASCGTTNKLNVHHIIPFYIKPEDELNQTNLITLCEHCHWVVGYREQSWTNYNPNLRLILGNSTNSIVLRLNN